MSALFVYRGYDQAALDAQYNARAAVPDHEEYFARYRALSERTRAKYDARLDVPYGSSELERLDIFPARSSGGPTWIFIHGGWWRSLDKADFSFVAEPFVASGTSVVCVNYRLAPDVPIAEIAREARAATRWVIDHAREWGGDPKRVFVGGHSAGGHLCGLIAVSEPVAGVTSISGVHELEPVFLSYANEWARLRRDEIVALSPLHQLPSRALPLIACVGGNESEEFNRQNAVYADAWRRCGYPVTELTLEGHHHFSIVLELRDPESALTAAVLAQVLG